METKDIRFKDAWIGVKAETAVGEDRVFDAVITSAVLDRDKEVLLPSGADFSEFKDNPVLLWSHNHDVPAIGTWIEIRGGDTEISGKARVSKATQLSNDIWNLIADGVVKAVSIGFAEIESRNPTKKDLSQFGESVVRVVSKYKVYEISVCNIPANQQALITSVGKGLVSRESVKSLFGLTDKDFEATPEAKPEIENTPNIPSEEKDIECLDKAKIDRDWAELENEEKPKPIRKRIIVVRQEPPSIEDIVRREIDRVMGKLY